MHKYFAAGFAIYLAGDPTLSMLASVTEARELVVATVLALIAGPWVISQFEN